MHMEKCGGTSLHRLLEREYAEGFFLYDPGPPGAAKPQEFPEHLRCVHGHMFYGLHEHFPDRVCEYITLLRDPVDRFVSNFEYVCRYEHPLHAMATGPEGFDRFCSEPAARHYGNLFVRRLAGVWDEVSEDDLDRAERILRTFAVVGQLENAAGFVHACADRFGWREQRLAHLNASPSPRRKWLDYPQDVQRRACAANALDLQLMHRIQDILVD